MKNTSILNDVLGPVMRGPSSSHTAASHHLGTLFRSLLGDEPVEARVLFDPDGSYGKVYKQQGSDLGFAAGLMGRPMTDERFLRAVDHAASSGLKLSFDLERLPKADHPNSLFAHLAGKSGRTLDVEARSVGGGSVEITSIEGWPVLFNGQGHEVAVECESSAQEGARLLLDGDGSNPAKATRLPEREDLVLLCVHRNTPLPSGLRPRLEKTPGVRRIWSSPPLCFVKSGTPLFRSAQELLSAAQDRSLSAGSAALAHESGLLGLSADEVTKEMCRRFDLMAAAVRDGLGPNPPSMQLLEPTAARIFAAEAKGSLAAGGMHTRAAARAMAAMNVNCGMGVVCAAPTAGSAGVLPGVAVTLCEEMGVTRDKAALALLAAGAIGVVLAERATFAAEVAGCQVEIGAACAMAAAAVVEAAGGTAAQAIDAAAISFQNSMGSVCDLVQGIVEIPCHTRNAAAASSAFVCADLVMGGYVNPIPLDETIDAVDAVGKALPRELKVTALGGLAATPSGRALRNKRKPTV